jgi:archaeosortase A (PGF-CTERM-specific)
MDISTILFFGSGIAFIASLIPVPMRKYCAMMGWTCVVGAVFVRIPTYLLVENNFMYPILALLSLPFLYITLRLLLRENELVLGLSLIPAIAWLIYMPFWYIETLRTGLIAATVDQISMALWVLDFPVELIEWNIFMHNQFLVEIVFGCTGISSIAILMGFVFAVQTSRRQKMISFCLIVPVILFANLLRNVVVIMAYTDQWFASFPALETNGKFGYSSYFWAHNVISEVFIALVTIILLAYALFLINPELVTFVRDVVDLYRGELRNLGVSLGVAG